MKGKVWALLCVVTLATAIPTYAAVTLEGEFKHQVTVREDLILTTPKTGGEIALWDLDRSWNGHLDRPTSTLRSGLASIDNLLVSPDSRYFAVTGIKEDPKDGKLAAILVYSSDGRQQHSLVALKASDPPALAAFDDWRMMAFYVGGDLGRLDLRTGRQVLFRRDRAVTVDSLSISPDGETVTTTSQGKVTSYNFRDEERDSRRRD